MHAAPPNKRPRDTNRVNIHEYWEVDYWCKRIGCTRAQLIVAVHTVGPNIDGVCCFLREAAPRSRLQMLAVNSSVGASLPPPSPAG